MAPYCGIKGILQKQGSFTLVLITGALIRTSLWADPTPKPHLSEIPCCFQRLGKSSTCSRGQRIVGAGAAPTGGSGHVIAAVSSAAVLGPKPSLSQSQFAQPGFQTPE